MLSAVNFPKPSFLAQILQAVKEQVMNTLNCRKPVEAKWGNVGNKSVITQFITEKIFKNVIWISKIPKYFFKYFFYCRKFSCIAGNYNSRPSYFVENYKLILLTFSPFFLLECVILVVLFSLYSDLFKYAITCKFI